jgi:hypothetical protein
MCFYSMMVPAWQSCNLSNTEKENVLDNSSLMKEALDRDVRAEIDDLLQQNVGASSSNDEK